MANKQVPDNTPVTLVTTAMFTPYRAGEVFTVPKDKADALLQAEYKDEDGKPVPPKVRLFDPSRDEGLLAQYGETLKNVKGLTVADYNKKADAPKDAPSA